MFRILRFFILSKKLFLLAIFMMLASSFLTAQKSSNNPQESTKPKEIGMIEEVKVRLILIDVVVEDRDGNRIHDLLKDDFNLFVDGREKPISTFDVHCIKRPYPVDLKSPIQDKESKVTPTLPDSFEDVEPRYILFYFDGTHLTGSGRVESLRAVKKFILEDMESHDYVMIASYGKRLHVLQYFTSDKQKLREAIQKLWEESELMDDYGMGEWARLKDLAAIRGKSGAGDPWRGFRKSGESVALGYAFENHLKTLKSVEALRSVLTLLEPIKSKKALIYFSDSLRDTPGILYVGPSYRNQLNIDAELRRLVNEANSSRVSIYAVDALGLTAPADRSYEASVLNALSTLSIDTGGKVLKNSNDLTRFIPVMKQDLDCYYTLGYYPEQEGDGRQHALNVTIYKPRLIVRAQTGFFYYTDEEVKSRKILSAFLLPQLFQDISILADLFLLRPLKNSWESLIQIAINLEEIKRVIIPQKELNFVSTLYKSNKVVKEINYSTIFTIKEDRVDEAPQWLIYQEKFNIRPDHYKLVAVVKDAISKEIGATEIDIAIPDIPKENLGIGSILMKGSYPIELIIQDKDSSQGTEHSSFPIRPDKQFSIFESIVIVTPVCSLLKDFESSFPQISLKRRLISNGQKIKEFDPISMSESPDPSTGCYNIIDVIPPNTLGAGSYTYEIELFDNKIIAKKSADFHIH